VLVVVASLTLRSWRRAAVITAWGIIRLDGAGSRRVADLRVEPRPRSNLPSRTANGVAWPRDVHRTNCYGAVSFTITASSAPATLLAKAADPAGRALQRRIISRCLHALAD
jgi:Domain of unknown function (DUF1990)